MTKKIFILFLITTRISSFGQTNEDTLHILQLTHVDTIYKNESCKFYLYNNKPFTGATLDTIPSYELGMSSRRNVPTAYLSIFKNGFLVSTVSRQNGFIILTSEIDENSPTSFTIKEYQIVNHLTSITRKEKGKYLFSKTFDSKGRLCDIQYFNLDIENTKKKTISYNYSTGCKETIIWSKKGQRIKTNCRKRRIDKTVNKVL